MPTNPRSGGTLATPPVDRELLDLVADDEAQEVYLDRAQYLLGTLGQVIDQEQLAERLSVEHGETAYRLVLALGELVNVINETCCTLQGRTITRDQVDAIIHSVYGVR